LTGTLLDSIDLGSSTYYEPFAGAAALFFALEPHFAVLGDLNIELITVYSAVRNQPLDLIDALAKWSNDYETYYRVRGTSFDDIVHRAARTLYLNKTCWNGLYRVNREGGFNVPFGNHGRQVFDADHLIQASMILRRAELVCSDFASTVSRAKPGDVVYFDPPYTALHSANGFRRYNETLFTWDDQIRLAAVAEALVANGCHVIVSNSCHDEILALYPGFQARLIDRASVMSGKSSGRGRVTEAIFESSSMLRARH